MNKVLLIEDDTMSQMMMARFLKKQELDVELAEDGQVAINYLEKAHPGVILMDLNLPIKTGWDVMDWMKAEELCIPVIIITASIEPSVKERALSYPCDSFMLKPINLPHLLSEIHRLLDSKMP